jgi:penicillin-binding protein 1B
VSMARRAGIDEDLKPTPAVALGAYDVTPFEIARAYTVFANNGAMTQPHFIRLATDHAGQLVYQSAIRSQRVLDPRVNYQMVSMLQDVMRSGTAAGVRARGFTLPAAGKTGTSHDGWFAGFTSQLLCIVWVGFDDYTELGLEGAKSALPIWTEFMKGAAAYAPYRESREFRQPNGLARTNIDPTTGQIATDFCPGRISEVFIDGTQPQEICARHAMGSVPNIQPMIDNGGVSTLTAAPSPAPSPVIQ